MNIGDKHGYLEIVEIVENAYGTKFRARCNKCGREIWITKSKFKERSMCLTCRAEKFGGIEAYEAMLEKQRAPKHKCWSCIHATNKYGKCDWSAWLIERDDWVIHRKADGKFNVIECKGYINDKYKDQYEREQNK